MEHAVKYLRFERSYRDMSTCVKNAEYKLDRVHTKYLHTLTLT